MKLDRAQQMLAQSQMQLSSIGRVPGIHESEHFTRLFANTPEKHPPNIGVNTAAVVDDEFVRL